MSEHIRDKLSLLSDSFVTHFCHTLLSPTFVTQFCHTVLSRSFVTEFCHAVLSHKKKIAKIELGGSSVAARAGVQLGVSVTNLMSSNSI